MWCYRTLFGLLLGFATAAMASVLFARKAEPVTSAAEVPGGKPIPTHGCVLDIELGVKDKQPTHWGGRIELSTGTILRLSLRNICQAAASPTSLSICAFTF